MLSRNRNEAAIAQAIGRALDGDHVLAARQFARLLADERGVEHACDEIDRFLA